ncbi:energy-coupling factor transport system ATP-binding protein [Natronobacillus azotifigens]|uniref:Energy-coupling factor transporter ATP-binding protein EcfA2 n=1 Tax=Natronobacillus azotifigens TaxID=472978 RepID=A0A9J6RDG3_9BACI|nr:energy-coupling factor transporter ATPase [Natronobacillus azotifigens]MCZ0703583.1 energy-coupling factor transporter ATPase [Natronobacillus azotifigens]
MQIKFDHVTADYQLGPIRSANIIQDLDLLLPKHSFTAVIGHTGAGKSSLLKLINGLLLPREGNVVVGDTTITREGNKESLKQVRKKVGMVFQFPEAQLFAQTVEEDIAYGPMNFGLSKEEAIKEAQAAAQLVGLDQDVLKKSPFSLSGGQQRRVAIAGILASNPEVLVLDEPGAGLDPEGKREIMALIKQLHEQKKITTLLVTHDMDDVALYAEDVLVMEKGSVVAHRKVRDFFEQLTESMDWAIELPEARRFQLKIEAKTGRKLPIVCLTIEELTSALIEAELV